MTPCEAEGECCDGYVCGDTSLGHVCCGETGAACGTVFGTDCCGVNWCVIGSCEEKPPCEGPCKQPPALIVEKDRLAAIGGKDSMSGSFNDLDVPPTLVSFALAPGKASRALSPEFKEAGSRVSLLEIPRDADHLPDFAKLKQAAERLHQLNAEGKILSLHAPGHNGLAVALAKMTSGLRATSSAASGPMRSMLPPPQRYSSLAGMSTGVKLRLQPDLSCSAAAVCGSASKASAISVTGANHLKSPRHVMACCPFE